VTCDTAAIRDELAVRGLVAPDRLVVAPLGVDEVFFETKDAAAERVAAQAVPPPVGTIEILHVGSTAPRKRVDVLLRVCGALGREIPQLRLTRIGDPLTPEQQQIARDAGMADRVTSVADVDESTLAALYRRAALVLQPSEREGFGLPIVEALAAGTPVVASDLPVLREVGGPSVAYCAVGDVDAWRGTVAALLRERHEEPARWKARRDAGRQHARRFRWPRFAADLARVYREIAGLKASEAAPQTTERNLFALAHPRW
jgi:glycosyltransferase involved in cell wall biosynthesis